MHVSNGLQTAKSQFLEHSGHNTPDADEWASIAMPDFQFNKFLFEVGGKALKDVEILRPQTKFAKKS
jgi:hypothetical protein